MPRTSAAITQQEVDAFDQFATQHNIIDDESAEGQKNGELLGGVIMFKRRMDITPATLADAYNQIKDHLVHYTPLQIEHSQLSARLSEQDRNTILHVVTARGLKDTGDDQLANFNSIAKYLMDKNMPITAGNLDMVLPNIVSSSQYRLTWKKRLQDSEREAQAAREAAKQQQPAKKADDEVKIPAGLPAIFTNTIVKLTAKLRPQRRPLLPARNHTSNLWLALRPLRFRAISTGRRQKAFYRRREPGVGSWSIAVSRVSFSVGSSNGGWRGDNSPNTQARRGPHPVAP